MLGLVIPFQMLTSASKGTIAIVSERITAPAAAGINAM